MYSICVIVPYFNEANRFPVDLFLGFLRHNSNVQYCFIDDGSTDTTRYILEDMRTKYADRITIQTLPINHGKAGAVQAGMLTSVKEAFDYIGFIDADLATPLEAMTDLAQTLEDNPTLEAVMGSRIQYLGRSIQRNLLRHYVGRVLATLICNMLQVPVYDTQCGAKLFRYSIVETLFQVPFVSSWLFDVEILARLIQRHGRFNLNNYVIEKPLRQWTEQNESRIRPSYLLTIWYDLYRIQRMYSGIH